jgi:hypothetical protein
LNADYSAASVPRCNQGRGVEQLGRYLRVMSQSDPLPRSPSKPTSYGKPNNLGTPEHVGMSCMLSAVLAANWWQVKSAGIARVSTRSRPIAKIATLSSYSR